MPTVLLIDDDNWFRGYLTDVLEREGFGVLSLENGLGVAELLKHSSIDAVVTDLYMPQMDGIEICRAVRRIAPHLPVICLTGSTSSGRDSCLDAMMLLGAKAFLTKPIDQHALIDILHHTIGNDPDIRRSAAKNVGESAPL
jgi:CheY-like chemotaxis protein